MFKCQDDYYRTKWLEITDEVSGYYQRTCWNDIERIILKMSRLGSTWQMQTDIFRPDIKNHYNLSSKRLVLRIILRVVTKYPQKGYVLRIFEEAGITFHLDHQCFTLVDLRQMEQVWNYWNDSERIFLRCLDHARHDRSKLLFQVQTDRSLHNLLKMFNGVVGVVGWNGLGACAAFGFLCWSSEEDNARIWEKMRKQ